MRQPGPSGRPSCKISTWIDASQALADAMGSIQEAQEAIQDTNQAWMLNHTLQSAWPDDLRQALQKGAVLPPGAG